MSRAQKQKVDFFPHDCSHGRVIFILEKYWKNDGYAVFYKLLELLGSTEGHYLDFSKPGKWEYFLALTLLDEQTVDTILTKLADLSVIDQNLWKHRIVWDQDFVDDLDHIYSRRVTQKPVKPVFPNTEIPLSEQSVYRNPSELSINAQEPAIKVKESKVKEHICARAYSVEFEKFYAAYPKKKAKDKAWEAWKKRNGSRPGIEVILSAVEEQVHGREWRRDGGQYIPYPATWINQGRWDDVVEGADDNVDQFAMGVK